MIAGWPGLRAAPELANGGRAAGCSTRSRTGLRERGNRRGRNSAGRPEGSRTVPRRLEQQRGDLGAQRHPAAGDIIRRSTRLHSALRGRGSAGRSEGPGDTSPPPHTLPGVAQTQKRAAQNAPGAEVNGDGVQHFSQMWASGIGTPPHLRIRSRQNQSHLRMIGKNGIESRSLRPPIIGQCGFQQECGACGLRFRSTATAYEDVDPYCPMS